LDSTGRNECAGMYPRWYIRAFESEAFFFHINGLVRRTRVLAVRGVLPPTGAEQMHSWARPDLFAPAVSHVWSRPQSPAARPVHVPCHGNAITAQLSLSLSASALCLPFPSLSAALLLLKSLPKASGLMANDTRSRREHANENGNLLPRWLMPRAGSSPRLRASCQASGVRSADVRRRH
jgi:hypothetical protein